MSEYVCGLDLGQAADYTAFVVALIDRSGEEPTVELQNLHRFKLGTSYPQIVEQIQERMSEKPLSRQVPLVVDGTGVGRAIVDMVVDAGLEVVPVTIHGGESVFFEDSFWRTPKKDLVAIIQSLLQTRRLKVSRKLKHADTLTKELLNFEVRISAQGHASFGCWRENSHDDLVLACSLALWYALRAPRSMPVTLLGAPRPSGGFSWDRWPQEQARVDQGDWLPAWQAGFGRGGGRW